MSALHAPTDRLLDIIVARCVAGAAIAFAVPAATAIAALSHAALNDLPVQVHGATGAYIGLLLDSALLFVFLYTHVACVQSSIKFACAFPLYLWFRLSTPRYVTQATHEQPTTVQPVPSSLVLHTAAGWLRYSKHQEVTAPWKARGKQAIASANGVIEGDYEPIEESAPAAPSLSADATMLLTELHAGRYPGQRVCTKWPGWHTDRWARAVQELKDAQLVIVEPRKPIRLNAEC